MGGSTGQTFKLISIIGAAAPISTDRGMQEFSDKTAPHQIPLEAFGFSMRVCTNSPELMERVQSILPPGWRRIPRSSRQVRVGLLKEDNEIYSIHRDALTDKGEIHGPLCVHDAPGREYALMRLETLLSTIIATESRDFVVVHAGVVADGDRAIVIPGMSFSGKTTLVRALVQAGAVYYSDECAMLHEDGRVHPYARQLSYRPPNRDAVELKVEHLGGVAGTEPLPIGMVILTRFRPGGEWRPRELSAGAAVLATLEHTIAARERPEQTVRVLNKAIAGAVALEGERGEADQLAGVLLETLRAAA